MKRLGLVTSILLLAVGCGTEEQIETSSLASATSEAKRYLSSRVEIDGALVAQDVNRYVNESSPFSSNSRGVQTSGTSTTRGDFTSEVGDSTRSARFDVVFQGNISNSANHSTRREGRTVKYCSNSSFGVGLRRTVFFRPNQGFGMDPAKININANSFDFCNIRAYRPNGAAVLPRVLQNQVKPRVRGSRGETISKMKSSIKSKIVQRIDNEIGSKLSKANADYHRKVYRPLIQTGHLPGQLVAVTTNGTMKVDVHQDLDPIHGKITKSPELEEGDVRFWMHHSLFNGIAINKFQGKKLTFEQFKRQLGELMDKPVEITDQDRKYSISFPEDKIPVEIRFADGNFMKLLIRSSGYFVNDSRQPSMNVFMTYKLELNDKGEIIGKRQGDINVLPTGAKPGDRLSSRQRDLARKLKKRYGEQFKEEINSVGFNMASPFESGMSSGKLKTKQLVIKDGWIAILKDRD